MAWEVVLLDEVEEWFLALDEDSAEQVSDAIDQLAERGPVLGAPLVKLIRSSALHQLKELRPGSAGGTEVRVLFCFDPNREAILLVAGDKAGRWNAWYPQAIATAEDRYERWLAGGYAEER